MAVSFRVLCDLCSVAMTSPSWEKLKLAMTKSVASDLMQTAFSKECSATEKQKSLQSIVRLFRLDEMAFAGVFEEMGSDCDEQETTVFMEVWKAEIASLHEEANASLADSEATDDDMGRAEKDAMHAYVKADFFFLQAETAVKDFDGEDEEKNKLIEHEKTAKQSLDAALATVQKLERMKNCEIAWL